MERYWIYWDAINSLSYNTFEEEADCSFYKKMPDGTYHAVWVHFTNPNQFSDEDWEVREKRMRESAVAEIVRIHHDGFIEPEPVKIIATGEDAYFLYDHPLEQRKCL